MMTQNMRNQIGNKISTSQFTIEQTHDSKVKIFHGLISSGHNTLRDTNTKYIAMIITKTNTIQINKNELHIAIAISSLLISIDKPNKSTKKIFIHATSIGCKHESKNKHTMVNIFQQHTKRQ